MKQTLLLLALGAGVFLPAQNWQYFSVAGTTGSETATAVATEPSGAASYAGGTFTDSIILGPVTYIAAGTTDGYVAKYSSNGLVQWSVQIASAQNVAVADVAYEANYAYVTGTFSGTIWIGNDSVTSNGLSDIFICRFNTTNGALSWLVRHGGSGNDNACSIAVGSNTFCVGGSFSNTWPFGADSIYSFGGTDACMLVCNLSGAPLWSRIGGGAYDDCITSVCMNTSGDCYGLGSFIAIAFFGPVTLTSSGYNDLFVQKYSANGSWGWIRPIYGAGEEYVADAAIDPSGKVYVVGTTTSLILSFMSQAVSMTDSLNGFLASYDANGYATWIRHYPRFVCQSVSCTNAHVFVVGTFTDTCLFGQLQFVSAGLTDVCIVKCTTGGTFISAHQCGGISSEEAHSLAVDQNSTVYLSGAFSGGQTYFAPYVAQNADPSGQTPDTYVGKFPAALLAVDEHSAGGYVIYPNPFTDYLTIELPSTLSQVVLYDISGKEMLRTTGTGFVRIARGGLAAGMYILAVTDAEGICLGRKAVIAE